MLENPSRSKQARNFTSNFLKILDLKSSSEQIFSENWRSTYWLDHWLNHLKLTVSIDVYHLVTNFGGYVIFIWIEYSLSLKLIKTERKSKDQFSTITFFRVISEVEMYLYILRSFLHMYELLATGLVIKIFPYHCPILFHLSDLLSLHLLI